MTIHSSQIKPTYIFFFTSTHAGHPAAGALALQEADEGNNNADYLVAPPAPGGTHSARPSVSGEGNRGQDSGGNEAAHSENGSNQDYFG